MLSSKIIARSRSVFSDTVIHHPFGTWNHGSPSGFNTGCLSFENAGDFEAWDKDGTQTVPGMAVQKPEEAGRGSRERMAGLEDICLDVGFILF